MTQLDYKELNDSFIPGEFTALYVHNEHDESYGLLLSIEPVNKETIEKYGFSEYDFSDKELEAGISFVNTRHKEHCKAKKCSYYEYHTFVVYNLKIKYWLDQWNRNELKDGILTLYTYIDWNTKYSVSDGELEEMINADLQLEADKYPVTKEELKQWEKESKELHYALKEKEREEHSGCWADRQIAKLLNTIQS